LATPTATVITGAGTDDRVAGLVYICALAPDADESSQTQQSKFPTTDVFSHIEVVDGRISLRKSGTVHFCGDLSEQEQKQKLVWATQGVPKPDLFGAKAGGTASESKPSWYIVGKQDRTAHPDLERAMAKRMGATTYELDSSHVPMLSQPERVLEVIRALDLPLLHPEHGTDNPLGLDQEGRSNAPAALADALPANSLITTSAIRVASPLTVGRLR
jgi:pimeloyl-ACP methyl ester carboxylesterase